MKEFPKKIWLNHQHKNAQTGTWHALGTNPTGTPYVPQEKLDSAYAERNVLAVAFAVLALRLGLKAGIRVDTDHADWGEDWCQVVTVDLPFGQVCWHMAPEQVPLAKSSLPVYDGGWNGKFTGQMPDWPILIEGTPSLLKVASERKRLREALVSTVDGDDEQKLRRMLTIIQKSSDPSDPMRISAELAINALLEIRP